MLTHCNAEIYVAFKDEPDCEWESVPFACESMNCLQMLMLDNFGVDVEIISASVHLLVPWHVREIFRGIGR